MDILEGVLAVFGGMTAVIALIVFLARFLLKQLAAKDLEEHKATIGRALESHKSQLARQAEAHRAELSRITNTHRQKSELIIKLRFEVLLQVWEQWVAVRNLVAAMTRFVVFEGEDQEVQAQQFTEALEGFVTTFDNRRVIFRPDAEARIEEAIDLVWKHMGPIVANIKARSDGRDSRVDTEQWMNSVKTLREEAPKLDKVLLAEIRKEVDSA